MFSTPVQSSAPHAPSTTHQHLTHRALSAGPHVQSTRRLRPTHRASNAGPDHKAPLAVAPCTAPRAFAGRAKHKAPSPAAQNTKRQE
eukprot:350288-Chlamydomonas_euryale.AAC.8